MDRTEAARAAERALSPKPSPALDLSTAPPDVRDLIAKIDALADELGLTITPARTGRNYRPAVLEAGVKYATGIGVYATGRGAEFNLSVFRELGADDVADDNLRRLCDVTGVGVEARSWPAVPCETITADWIRARSELIEPYFEARRKLRAWSGNPRAAGGLQLTLTAIDPSWLFAT